MTTPLAIQCVELAAGRAASDTHAQLNRRVSTLASISATAVLVGSVGTVIGIMASFQSYTGPKSGMLAGQANRISQAMVPTILGLLVALVAYLCYQYLTNQLQGFDREMKGMSLELINRLRPYAPHCVTPTLPGLEFERVIDEPAEPQFLLPTIYGPGLTELIWPELDSPIDREVVLDAAAGICLSYGLLAAFSYWCIGRTPSGLVTLAFFLFAASCIKQGSRAAIVAVCVFFMLTASFVFAAWGWSLTPIACLAAPILLIGGWKAASHKISVHIALVPLLLLAVVSSLFGTVLAYYRSSYLTNYSHIALNQPFMGQIQRGDFITTRTGFAFPARVVALPGDRVDVKAGILILNGHPVSEPYAKPYLADFGDLLNSAGAYGYTLSNERPYLVPTGAYFILNDDRSNIWDSRTLGPVPVNYVTGKLLLSYRLPWYLQHLEGGR